MLVLSRKEGQTIQISDDITITVNSVRGNRVTLGIVAPKHLHIRRGELEAGEKQESPTHSTITLPAMTQSRLTEGCFA